MTTTDKPAPRCVLCKHWRTHAGGMSYCGNDGMNQVINDWHMIHWTGKADPQDPVCPGFMRREEGER